MKKIGAVLMLVCLMAVGAGCSNGDTAKVQPSQTSKKENAAQQDKNASAKKETITEQVSVQPGLGDTVEAFSKQYGENKGNAQMGRFKGDYLLPMYVNNHAVDLTLQFEATDQKVRTMEEAKQLAAQMIPKDAKLEKEFTDTSDLPQKVMVYHSDTLAKLFPDMKPAGKFVVIFNYHDGKENEVFSVNIGLGDTQ